MYKFIPPRTRKELEQKLKEWDVKKINGIPLRHLHKEILRRAYCQKAQQLLEEQKQKLPPKTSYDRRKATNKQMLSKTLPLPGFAEV